MTNFYHARIESRSRELVKILNNRKNPTFAIPMSWTLQQNSMNARHKILFLMFVFSWLWRDTRVSFSLVDACENCKRECKSSRWNQCQFKTFTHFQPKTKKKTNRYSVNKLVNFFFSTFLVKESCIKWPAKRKSNLF